MDDEVVNAVCMLAAGDARSALTTLELASEIAITRGDGDGGAITLEDVRVANPRRGLSYDKSGDMHYDIISAFIKSMRGSDPDAAVYWLARMIDAGEDPKFIARRILIAASEDIGNADPQAILVAEAAFKSAEVIGYPECRINLAQARCICATGIVPVPMNTVLYLYPHDYQKDGWNSATFQRGSNAGRFGSPPAGAGKNGGWSSLPATVADARRKSTKDCSPPPALPGSRSWSFPWSWYWV